MSLQFMEVDRAAQFVLMLDGLTTEQKQKVEDLGFGCLFKLHPIQFSRLLIVTLSKVYQSDVQTFRIGENNVSLTPRDAYCIMGLRDEGIHINMFKKEAPNEGLVNMFENPKTHNISFRDLKSRILNLGTTDENFVRMFVLLMIAGLLAQPVDDHIPWEYVKIVENVDRVSKYNWAEFTVSFLHRSLIHNKSTKMSLEGNFILLQLWYYEHVQANIANNYVNHHHPLMSKWTREKMKCREDYERRHGRFHENIIGTLNISQVEEELNSFLDEVQIIDSNSKMDHIAIGEGFQVKEISKTLWTSTISHKKRNDEHVWQLPTKTPEKMTENKKRQVIMVYDDNECERENYKSNKTKQRRLREDIYDIGLTKDEIAAVQYVIHTNSTAEIVRMKGDTIGFLTLTGGDMNCLIQPTNETGPCKWINDQVLNCGMIIMDPTRHCLLRVMAVDTYNTCLYARSHIKETPNKRELQRWAKSGSQFLESDLVFFPINFKDLHWYVGVLNLELKQFQILDSIAKHSSLYTGMTLNLCNGIQFLISLALDTNQVLRSKNKHLDITDWPVKLIETPQQQDDHSCGLFVLKFIELWEGNDKWNSSLEVQPELFRKQLVHQLIFSDKNELKNVQDNIYKNGPNMMLHQ